MDDNDSIISADVGSLLRHNTSFKHLPKSADNSINTEDLTSSSSDAVIKALQTLQQKIRKLELERAQAEKNFGSITKDTEKLKAMVKSTVSSKSSRPDEELHRLVPVSATSTPRPADPAPTNTPSANTSISVPREEAVRYNAKLQEAVRAPPPLIHVDKYHHPTVKVRERWDTIGTKGGSGDINKGGSGDMRAAKPVLYHPSPSQPYATYIRSAKPDERDAKLHDSRVNILEKQLEYMRRLVHSAEQERIKATEKMSNIEQEKENQKSLITQEELEKQNTKISELERECSQLTASHIQAEDKIKELAKKLQREKESRTKLIQQTEELARVTEENKHLMLSLTPSLPPSPPPPPPAGEKKRSKKKRKRPSSSSTTASSGVAVPAANPANWKSMPFVCGKSSSPSHSLSVNVQQMLSALKQENPSLCARITTQRSKQAAASDKDIKQVIRGLEDDLGALTFEYQHIASTMTADNNKEPLQKQLDLISLQMETKSQHIRKLTTHLKKFKKEQTVVKARPVSRPLSTLSNREVQISLRGRNTRELLSKVKTIRDVLTNKDLHWV